MIRITPHGHEQAAETLDGRQVKSRITQAIRQALQRGKQSGKKLVKGRYVSNLNSMGKISSRASGLSGRLTISGNRNLIKRFKVSPSTRPPHNPPGGIHVQIVRGQGGMLPHAFIGKGDVWERVGRERYKICRLMTVGLPGGWGYFSSQVEQAIARQLEKSMEAVL